MKEIVCLLLGASLSLPVLAATRSPLEFYAPADASSPAPATAPATDSMADGLGGLEESTPEEKSEPGKPAKPAANTESGLLPGARFTLKHELAARVKSPNDVSNNRSSFRMEYEKHFQDTYYLHFDASETWYWPQDHRASARGESFASSSIRDAYLQYSKESTSVKLGRQILIWGESDAGAITDVISPRNLSELFFISLEASRISQFMLTVDQFSPIGDWSMFYVPRARFNEYPTPGTAYYVDGFNGAQVQTVEKGGHEFGLRWKKTFGNTDLSLMAARLIDNDYAIHKIGTTLDNRLIIKNDEQRFNMFGATFTHSTDGFLFSGEIAKKTPKAYLDSGLQVAKKDALDTSLKVEHNLGNGGNHAISLEVVNKKVLNWDNSIMPTPRNTNTLVLAWRNSFLNDNLSANYLTVYNQTYPSFSHSLFLNYKVNSSVNLSLDAFYLSVKDKNNELYSYRGLNKAVFRVLYQF